jgi:hypothetical protein
MSQMNLGNALLTLGERKPGTARLEEAVAAYRSALEEWTRERVPLDWAMSQMNLGIAHGLLGERARDRETLALARAEIQAAWGLYRESGYDQYDGYFQGLLGQVDAANAALGEAAD